MRFKVKLKIKVRKNHWNRIKTIMGTIRDSQRQILSRLLIIIGTHRKKRKRRRL